MIANRPSHEMAEPVHLCGNERGCRHLRALATIEEIAGYAHVARTYATAANQCGCGKCRPGAGSKVRARESVPAISPAIRLDPLRCARAAAVPSRSAEIVRLDHAAAVDIFTDQEGNCVERRALKLETLPAQGDPLGYLYQYWRDLRAASAWAFANIDTVHLERAGIIGRMHVVDVSSSDPWDFRYELFGHAVPIGCYESPRAHPVAIWKESLLRDYNTVRMTGVPRLHRVRTRLNRIGYHYTRLILPFLNHAGHVDRLAVMIRQEVGDGLST